MILNYFHMAKDITFIQILNDFIMFLQEWYMGKDREKISLSLFDKERKSSGKAEGEDAAR